MKPPGRARDRRRVDVLLVERGLAPSREKAQAFVIAGLVSSGGRPIAKPGTLVSEDEPLHVAPTRRFVSRGGDKIDGALARLGLDVAGVTALDVGASTGGFTDCLLQRGAARVVALDVGRGQLDWSLRNDPRVTVIEGVNARYLDDSAPLGPFDLIVVDVSFISLRLVIPALAPTLKRPVDAGTAAAPEPAPLPAILALVKPQFELGRGSVGRGGIVREPAKHYEAILDVVTALTTVGRSNPEDAASCPPRAPDSGEAGPKTAHEYESVDHGSSARRGSEDQGRGFRITSALGVREILESPIRGAEGNREFFIYLVPGIHRSVASLREEARKVTGHTGVDSTE